MILYLVSKRYAEVYDLQEYAVFIALCNIALTCVRKYHFKYSASSPSAPAIRVSLNFLLLKVDLRLAFFVFKKHNRIQTKTKLTPSEKRNQLAA